MTLGGGGCLGGDPLRLPPVHVYALQLPVLHHPSEPKASQAIHTSDSMSIAVTST